ncbi:hypothetical protein TraAM80_10527 [Trypanosoma rangeli]|uniref:Uncharacterized protein n=1 Tax=Trypanosoma rangeli TaxID=5698 RepID=A0A3R7KI35_TRYRA|nr:uncharacterized protein TraAM80_10527 [Trypanosoma rangeli]RNE94879.1 hypothetical protein TraAM80_10527 [Trypanosoma rangeli]|eukprot:RNE94879.1 hypothetical protein TraAM80_10527 [Trypanosoma rangeli]
MVPSKLRKFALQDGFSVLPPAAWVPWAPATIPELQVPASPPLLLSAWSLPQRKTHASIGCSCGLLEASVGRGWRWRRLRQDPSGPADSAPAFPSRRVGLSLH